MSRHHEDICPLARETTAPGAKCICTTSSPGTRRMVELAEAQQKIVDLEIKVDEAVACLETVRAFVSDRVDELDPPDKLEAGVGDPERLRDLAIDIRDTFDCVEQRDDGGDWSLGDEGFDDHVHNVPYNGGNGCSRCMAIQALGPVETAKVPPLNCETCQGTGKTRLEIPLEVDGKLVSRLDPCTECGGTGRVDSPAVENQAKKNAAEFQKKLPGQGHGV